MNFTPSSLRSFALPLLLIITCGLAIILPACGQGKQEAPKWKYVDALVDKSRNPNPCVLANQNEQRLLELATSAIELGEVASPNSLDIGAQRTLGNGIYREINDDSHPICIQDALLRRVTIAIERRGGFGRGRIVEYQIALAAKLVEPGVNIVKAIGDVAFAETPQQSEIFIGDDMRPYARSVLASFGRSANEYSDIAVRQMGVATPMETGAAQVAAATGDVEVVATVASLISQQLALSNDNEPIPWNRRNRICELAWAIAFSGESAKTQIESIHSIMRRRVQSWAPPFGMVDAYPKQMCKALAFVSGRESIRKYAYCEDKSVIYEQ